MTLRFDKVHEDAMTGLRRAAVFLGLGVNAASREDLLEYRLDQDSNLQILPDVAEEVVAEWKSEFRVWIVAGGFRELVEHLCLFLDRIFHLAAQIPDADVSVTSKSFEKLGLDKKLEVLESRLGISSAFNDALATFYPVRNCLIHRLGRVGKKDVANGDLILKFHAPRLFVTTPSGEVDLPGVPRGADPIHFPKGGTMSVTPFQLVTRTFRVGEVINLSPHELHQILFFSQECVRRLLDAAVENCRSKGVVINGGSDLHSNGFR